MAAPPSSQYAALSRKATRLVVLLGDDQGNPPSVRDEAEWLLPISISRAAGGRRLDTMVLQVDLERAGWRLVDTTAPVGTNRLIQVHAIDDQGNHRFLSWGKMMAQQLIVDDGKETVRITARQDPYLFGRPLDGYLAVDSIDTQGTFTVNWVHRDVVFNPEVDGKIVGNRHHVTDPNDESYYFLDPDADEEAHRGNLPASENVRERWTLAEAVHALCWLLNPDEDYYKNPTLAELDVALAPPVPDSLNENDPDFADKYEDYKRSIVRNHRIRRGLFLPEALDRLLTPYGFGWYTIPTEQTVSGATFTTYRCESKFVFFRRGTGVVQQVWLQRPGESIDPTLANVSDLSIHYDIGRLRNTITGHTAPIVVESTFELQKGWPESADSTSRSNLYRKKDGVDPTIGNKWVLNESGKYTGQRSEITEPFDWSTVLDPLTEEKVGELRRRRFLPRVSVADQPAPDRKSDDEYLVEWHNPRTNQWERVPWKFSVLKNECGILFQEPAPPASLWQLIADGQPDQARVRITASVELDQRSEATAERSDDSPNADEVPLFLDLSRRFRRRLVRNSAHGSDRDLEDVNEMDDYLEELRKSSDAATVHTSIVLHGIDHPQYQIGDLIEKVVGRDLSLDANNPSSGNPKRPQIVGFNWRLRGGQSLELLLDTFREEIG
ncbi:MAG: hypothetical protein GXP27_14325 [Planctomycetes bacterium]|nr:hypothetical protein [Planctomycetota bacterium]